MKKINWNIPAVMYVIIMIWMCFEDMVPDRLWHEMGFFNVIVVWFAEDLFLLHDVPKLVIPAMFTVCYLISIYFVTVKKRHGFLLLPVIIAAFDNFVCLFYQTGYMPQMLLYAVRLIGLYCMLRAYKGGRPVLWTDDE